MNELADKTLIMIVGPSAVGKSTLMNEVVKLSGSFARVSGFTTRPPRADDEPGLYRYITSKEAEKRIRENKLVQYAVHPSTGVTYGTEPSDYPGEYNLLDTLSNVVIKLRALPFRETVTISLTAPAEQWREQFLMRYPIQSEDALKRLTEAKLSIEWSLAQTNSHAWLNNQRGELRHTAQRLIDIATHGRAGDDDTNARAILERIERGVWQ